MAVLRSRVTLCLVQMPSPHRFGCECDKQHGDERDCASSSPPVSAASQPAAQCQHSDYYPSCGNLLLSFVVLIASVLSQLQRGLRWLALHLTPDFPQPFGPRMATPHLCSKNRQLNECKLAKRR